MEKWVLSIGYSRNLGGASEKKNKDYSIFIRRVPDFGEALTEIQKKNDFLLIIIFSGSEDIIEEIGILRCLTEIPILVVSDEYDGREKIAAIEAGADEYIQCPDTADEGIASAYALIRRYTDLKRESGGGVAPLSRCGVFISPEYRRVFINSQEVEFPRKEFDLFYFFACNPGRVFTHEQLYREIWGDEYIGISDNSLNSCLRRIRRKLDMVPDAPCRIENRWGVGYCFVQ